MRLVSIGRENLEGDGQADRRRHGGPDMAVLGYAEEHLPALARRAGLQGSSLWRIRRKPHRRRRASIS
jgi:MOSC domain-containing protein YiiM